MAQLVSFENCINKIVNNVNLEISNRMFYFLEKKQVVRVILKVFFVFYFLIIMKVKMLLKLYENERIENVFILKYHE